MISVECCLMSSRMLDWSTWNPVCNTVSARDFFSHFASVDVGGVVVVIFELSSKIRWNSGKNGVFGVSHTIKKTAQREREKKKSANMRPLAHLHTHLHRSDDGAKVLVRKRQRFGVGWHVNIIKMGYAKSVGDVRAMLHNDIYTQEYIYIMSISDRCIRSNTFL